MHANEVSCISLMRSSCLSFRAELNLEQSCNPVYGMQYFYSFPCFAVARLLNGVIKLVIVRIRCAWRRAAHEMQCWIRRRNCVTFIIRPSSPASPPLPYLSTSYLIMPAITFRDTFARRERSLFISAQNADNERVNVWYEDTLADAKFDYDNA